MKKKNVERERSKWLLVQPLPDFGPVGRPLDPPVDGQKMRLFTTQNIVFVNIQGSRNDFRVGGTYLPTVFRGHKLSPLKT